MLKYEEIALDIRKNIPQMLAEENFLLPTQEELCSRYQVSRQTVRRALQVLTEENLVVSRQGSGCVLTGRSPDAGKNTVSLLLPGDREEPYLELIRTISRQMSRSGFSCRIHLTQNRISREREILASLIKDPPRGILCECCRGALPNPNRDLYVSLAQSGTAVVFLYGIYPDFPPYPVLYEDNVQGGQLLTTHLLKNGHRRIGGIFQSDTPQGRDRYFGYLCSLLDHGLPLPDREVLWFDSDMLERMRKKQDTAFLRDFLPEGLASCSAVVCYNDEIAYRLMRECMQEGIRIPADLSVVSFGGTDRYASEFSFTRLKYEQPGIFLRCADLMLSRICAGGADPEIPASYRSPRMQRKPSAASGLWQIAPVGWTLVPGNTDRRI